MIVDAHCHAGHGDGLTGPWDTSAPLGHYLRRCRAAGIGRTLLLASFHSDYHRANAEIASILRRAPDRFLAFAFVHPQRDRSRVAAMVGHAVGRWGFTGIKVHRHDAPITREVCEVARRWRLPVLYDVMGQVSQLRLLASEYPDVPFIIPHLGSFSDDWAAQSQLIDLMGAHPNLFTDTAGVRRFDLLEEAVRRVGASRVIFGSDGPWLHPGVELEKIRLLHLSPLDEGRVLAGNILGLTRRVRRPKSWPSLGLRIDSDGPSAGDPWAQATMSSATAGSSC